MADYAYFYGLSQDGVMVSVISLARRSSVVVSFLVAALLFKEKNLKSKAVDLFLVLLGMLFLYLGTL
jgi:transporter family protein